MEAACRAAGLALVYLLSPTSPAERIARVAAQTSGFLYLVSLTGVTGARSELPPELPEFVQRAREPPRTRRVAVGFGISTPEQARLVGGLADGVIVGSALIDAVRRSADPARAAGGVCGRSAQRMEHARDQLRRSSRPGVGRTHPQSFTRNRSGGSDRLVPRPGFSES